MISSSRPTRPLGTACNLIGDHYTCGLPLALGGQAVNPRDCWSTMMGQKCAICGKSPQVGNSVSQRGKAKYLGGNGRKTTGISKRRFKPNLQTIRIQRGGGTATRRVCTGCIRSGLVQKAVVRKAFTEPEVATG